MLSTVKFEKPWICLLSLAPQEVEVVKNDYLKVYDGSLGNPCLAKYTSDTFCKFLLSHDYPLNVQEYDIFVIDSIKETIVDYSYSDHQRKNNKSPEEYYFYTIHPQQVFDPRNYSKHFLFDVINSKKKKSIVVIFAGEKEEYTYHIKDFADYHSSEEVFEYSNYDHLGSVFNIQNKFGTEVLIEPSVYKKLFEKFSTNLSYHAVFSPFAYQLESYDLEFSPLAHNSDGEIISFLLKGSNTDVLIVPDIDDKAQFLKELLSDYLPDQYPQLFPFSEKNNWLNQKAYALPNHDKLMLELQDLETKYNRDRIAIDNKLSENKLEFEWLHSLIKDTGNELVNSVIKYFNWIGINKVIDKDETASILKEEDIQLLHGNKIVIAEVKGIFGTSKDDDCSQIAKVRFRRMKELNRTDIAALYIVNHQRNKPPLSRDNPPFKPHQITDAEDDYRGLLTTWQLFQAYFDICDGILSKQDIINQINNTGLIDFEPLTKFIKLGLPKEVHHKGEIVIIELENTVIQSGDELLIASLKGYRLIKVVSMKFNNQDVKSASNGEVGIKLNGKILATDQIWVKRPDA